MKGLFITFEGIEGSGKSTQLIRLATHLSQQGYSVISTREPGGTPFGEQIRKVLLSVNTHRLYPQTELFLYLASRVQHLEEVIRPSLNTGKIVLCDRFSDATLAYQGFGRGLTLNFVKKAATDAVQGLRPDLTLLLDLDVENGLSRIKDRGTANRLDRESLKFHQRVREGYLKLARAEPRRIRMVDASENIHAVASAINKAAFHVLKSYSKRLARKSAHTGKRVPS
jgi:dTMP kinase